MLALFKHSSLMVFLVVFSIFIHFSVIVGSGWFFMGSLCKSVISMLTVICLISSSVLLLYMLMMLLSTQHWASELWDLLQLAFELELHQRDTMD